MKMIIKFKMIYWIIFGYLSIFQWTLDNINGASIEVSGCYHNGTVYADRSLVPTMEPCLSCKCNSRMLKCSLKVCPEMPVPPPRGCVLVHRKNSCCPYLSCLQVHNFYNGLNRKIVSYLNHYEKESIDRAVNENFLQRRSDDFDMDGSGEICIKNGTVYKSGSAMSSSSLCSYCYCIGGQQKCVKPKCMLPLEGCKAIFVDSTCCPVRYDCTSAKTSAGKSAHRSHARKTSNKHYLRISQRYQRNRGCTIGDDDYYHEGQKMPNDKDSPCDICFCIRGIKKCAPKKCSPSLRYCIPVIPKGQCCPSSYECGSSRDNINRSYKSRQIGLFSLIFGSDDNDNSTDSTVADEKISEVITTSEKSIFDVIREGLEYIDSSTINNSSKLNNTSNLISTTTVSYKLNPITTKPNLAIDEEEDEDDDDDDSFSFLDILLGRTKTNTTLNNTTVNTNQNLSVKDDNYKDYDDDFFDLFLESRNATIEELKKENNTLLNDITTTDIYDLDYFGTTENDISNSDDYSAIPVDDETTTEHNENENTASTTSDSLSTTENLNDWTEDDFSTTDDNMLRTEESTTDSQQYTESLLDLETLRSDENEFSTMITTTDKNNEVYSTITTYLSDDYAQTEPRLNTEFSSSTMKLLSKAEELIISNNTKLENSIYSNDNTSNQMENNDNYNSMDNTENNNNYRIRYPSDVNLTSTATTTTTTTSPYDKEPISDDLFTSLLNGLSNLLGEDDDSIISNKTDIIIPNILIPSNNITNHQEEIIEKNITMEIIDENSNSSTTTPSYHQHSTSLLEMDNVKTASQINNLALPVTTTENSPVIIKTNPSILDLSYDYGHRTLPPSLPNLKIIPFLPVDALPTEKRQIIGSSFPSSIDRHSPAWQQSNSFDTDIKSVNKLYEHSERYPSITYSSDTNINNNNNNNNDNIDSKIIYLGNHNGLFSPPTKTEGGFLPKEPIVGSGGNLYYDSKIIIELTTTIPPFSSITQATKKNQQQNQIIAITSTDPFKDVIKTESPPNLISLIEDKENQKSNRLPSSFKLNENDDNNNSKEIIHITTDTNYNLIPEYNQADEYHNYGQNLNISNISFTEKMELFEKMNKSDINFSKNYSVNELENSIDDKVKNDNNVFSNLVEYFIGGNVNNVGDGGTFNNNKQTTIPPFKNLPPIKSFEKFLITEKSESIPPQPLLINQVLSENNTNIEIITIPPPIPSFNHNNSDDLSILEKLLLKSEYTLPDSELYKPIPQRKMTTVKEYQNKIMTISPSTTNDPFKGLPLTQSYPVKPQIEKKIINDEYQTELDIILSKINKKSNIKGATYTVGAYKLIPNDATISSTDSYVINPIDVDIQHHQQHLEYKSDIPAQISSKSTTNNSINDPAGILLAGCNIYGRMYRVGKIISELSDDCLECKCTEIGVSCLSLKCTESTT